MNYLNAVFWDYPHLTCTDNIRQLIDNKGDEKICNWVLQRFLEHGRVVDTISFFSLQTISKELSKLRLTPYTYKKWSRILEVYGYPQGR